MKVTVLGKSPSWSDAGGACSGYLVETDSLKLLLDCGNGVFGKLRRYADYTEIDAVLVSHMHADHFLDLVPYAYGLTYSPRQQSFAIDPWPGTDQPARPQLLVPEGGSAIMRQVVGAWGNDDLIDKAFDVSEYDAAKTLELGDLRVRFQQVPHFTRTYAIDIAPANGDDRRFTFGADCRPTEELVEFASGADLLFVEATIPRPERTGERGHMTPAEAADHAARAGVRRVVLTHITDELDVEHMKREAQEVFPGEVHVAEEGAVFEV